MPVSRHPLPRSRTSEPAVLAVETPVEGYEPDSVAQLGGEQLRLLVIEVKWEDLWAPPDSDPRVKARAADVWADTLSRGDASIEVEHVVILDRDAISAGSLSDVRDWASN